MTQTLVYIGKITPHSVQHPSTVLALRADPPSPTRGEGREPTIPVDPPPASSAPSARHVPIRRCRHRAPAA
ncbi:MAG: hypothetical protein EOS83_32240 [Mesorhizobium sp.]|nr:MAG: hypothetical protein EOS83_32240 [Mesorhizobium sp.]